MVKRIILASASPRRKELLSRLIKNFEILEPQVQEKELNNPYDTARENAIKKAEFVKRAENDVVIACDTVVALDNKIYHKPVSRDNAIQMLEELKGKWHKVYSGVAIIYKKKTSFVEMSEVKIKDLSKELIEEYVDNFEPYDKAGSYAIQDGVIVDSYKGDYENIVGLPLTKLQKILRETEINV